MCVCGGGLQLLAHFIMPRCCLATAAPGHQAEPDHDALPHRAVLLRLPLHTLCAFSRDTAPASLLGQALAALAPFLEACQSSAHPEQASLPALFHRPSSSCQRF